MFMLQFFAPLLLSFTRRGGGWGNFHLGGGKIAFAYDAWWYKENFPLLWLSSMPQDCLDAERDLSSCVCVCVCVCMSVYERESIVCTVILNSWIFWMKVEERKGKGKMNKEALRLRVRHAIYKCVYCIELSFLSDYLDIKQGTVTHLIT